MLPIDIKLLEPAKDPFSGQDLGQSTVILGENQVGKTNLLFALRLILDPALPDCMRQLSQADFWDGLPRPLSLTDFIQVSVDITDFETDEDTLAILADHLIIPAPMTARLTYEFRPIPSLKSVPANDNDYEFVVFGGGRPENRVNYDVRKRIPLDILHALRDVESAYVASPSHIATAGDLVAAIRKNPVETHVAVWLASEDAQWLGSEASRQADIIWEELNRVNQLIL